MQKIRAIAQTIKLLFARLNIWTFVGVTIASWNLFNSIIWLISFWLICCNIKSFFCGFVQLCVEFRLLVNLVYSVGSDARLRAKGQNRCFARCIRLNCISWCVIIWKSVYKVLMILNQIKQTKTRPVKMTIKLMGINVRISSLHEFSQLNHNPWNNE